MDITESRWRGDFALATGQVHRRFAGIQAGTWATQLKPVCYMQFVPNRRRQMTIPTLHIEPLSCGSDATAQKDCGAVSLSGLAMKRYVAFEMTFDGNVATTFYLYCADEEDAKAQAKALVDVHAVELWTSKSPRRIARFNPQSPNRDTNGK